MLRRWAEARMYRKTVQIAVAELRRAARTANALEKLQALTVAEQKLRDALWLCPEESKERFETGLGEIERSRNRTLHEALRAVERLLVAAEQGIGEPRAILRPAGELLGFLDHYLPDDPRVETLSARFHRLGGEQPTYQPVTPLAEMYRRPEGGAGCSALIGGLLLVLFLSCLSVYVIAQ